MVFSVKMKQNFRTDPHLCIKQVTQCISMWFGPEQI